MKLTCTMPVTRACLTLLAALLVVTCSPDDNEGGPIDMGTGDVPVDSGDIAFDVPADLTEVGDEPPPSFSSRATLPSPRTRGARLLAGIPAAW